MASFPPLVQQVPTFPSIHSAQVGLMANYTSGMQLHGRMSAVRRFFCLFVTFDLLFTSLLWIICVLVTGEDIKTAIEKQILEYSIKTSVFDIVVCSICRFILLIFFYAVLHINHWWLVALVTTLSCASLLAKSIIYQWTKDSSSPFIVFLVLSSFLISWAEAWFIDFRVIPQEARAYSILEVAQGNAEERNDSRLDQRFNQVRDYLSQQYSESVANFYSPLTSPADSDEEKCFEVPKRLSAQEAEFILHGQESLKLAWEMLNSGGWGHEKTISHTDIIFSKKCPKGYKIYKLMAVVEASPEVLFKECWYNFERIPDWNSSIAQCKLIQAVNAHVNVTYQVATEGPGGVVAQRDFVGVRHWTKMINCWVIAGVSVVHPDVPVYKNLVRGENGPNCIVFGIVEDNPDRCSFQWLLDVDLKGWIPKYVLEQAFIYVITNFLTSIKSYSSVLRTTPMPNAPPEHKI